MVGDRVCYALNSVHCFAEKPVVQIQCWYSLSWQCFLGTVVVGLVVIAVVVVVVVNVVASVVVPAVMSDSRDIVVDFLHDVAAFVPKSQDGVGVAVSAAEVYHHYLKFAYLDEHPTTGT